MSSQQHTELSFKEKVIVVLNDHWKIVVSIIGVAVIVMAGILILDYISGNKAVASSELAEGIQEAYADWMAEAAEDRDDTALMELIDEATSDYSRFFAAQRAAFTMGLIALENEEWEEAYTVFEDIAERWSDSYLASVSLFNAGSAREEAGDIDAAIVDWQKIADNYATVSADPPEALFNIGRVEESRGDVAAALEAYTALDGSYPDSRWTDIAKSRILVLESR